MSQVRVRFAPSPTGFFHIGGARTALFNWLYARHTGGVFILRIEDTDRERNREAFLALIYDSLTWLGLNWDEGPRVGGSFGPYRQNERGTIYQDYVQRLRDAGRAYERDGAVWFRLPGERYEVFDEHRKKTVTKVRIPPVAITDQIRGRVERLEDEDFVIVRSDGHPVFHLVNVVDDITMNVTHVIRGEDHLSNTSKHVHLFAGFGVTPPAFAHIPLILKQHGSGKMSKREQGALIEDYRRQGYLPEALVNFLCLLGWNPGDDREKMPMEEIIRLFDLPGINQSNARFDDRKLAHMNMAYLLELPPDRLVDLARQHFTGPPPPGIAVGGVEAGSSPPEAAAAMPGTANPGAMEDPPSEALAKEEALAKREALAAPADYFRAVMLLSQPKIKAIEELPAYTRYFFTEEFRVDPKVRDKVLRKGEPLVRLRELLAALPGLDFDSDIAIEEGLKALAAANQLGFGDYQAVARLAVTGTNVGPSLTGLFRVLGRQKIQARLERFLASAAPQ